MADTKNTIVSLADLTRVVTQIRAWVLSRVSHVEENEEVTAAALNDLNTRLESIESRLDKIEEVIASSK